MFMHYICMPTHMCTCIAAGPLHKHTHVCECVCVCPCSELAHFFAWPILSHCFRSDVALNDRLQLN